MAGGRTTPVAILCTLVLGIASFVGAGTAAAGEIGEPPPPGSTFQGTAPQVRVDLTVLAPGPDGAAQLRGTVAVECEQHGDTTRAGLEDRITGRVAADGTFDIAQRVSGPAEGIQSFGKVRLRGSFTDTGLDATIRYELTETDDTDEVIDECQVGPVPLETVTGPVDPGIALMQATIPIVKRSDDHYQAATATSTTAVFVAVRESEFSLDDLTTVLLRIDPETNEIVRRRTVDEDLWGLVTVDDRLFGIDVVGGNVVPIDPKTLETEEPIEVADEGDDGELRSEDAALWPRAAAVDGALWVSAASDREIVRIDPDAGTVEGRVDVERHPTNLAAGPAGLYAETHDDDGAVVRVDPGTMTLAATSTPRRSLDGVVADATQVLTTDYDPDTEASAVVQLDPDTLASTFSREFDPAPDLLIAAPPGSWGLQYERSDDVIVALDSGLSEVARVLSIGLDDNETQASSGFGSVWIYDEGLRLLYRLASS
jgi:hypothetical protein